MNKYKIARYENSKTAASLYSIIFSTLGVTALATGYYVVGMIFVAGSIPTGIMAYNYHKQAQQSDKNLESKVNESLTNNSEELERNVSK